MPYRDKCTNTSDQLYQVEEQLRGANNRLAESDANREVLLNEVKGLNHRLNTMDATEEMYKEQLNAEKDRAVQFEMEAAEYKRNVARLQMDNDKLDNDMRMFRADNMHLAQQLKEAEDRIAELTSSYNQIVLENKQLEHHRGSRHHHEPRSINAPAAVATPSADVSIDMANKERQLQASIKDLDEALTQLNKKESRISALENEVYVYQENYRMLTDQLREIEQVNLELKQQLRSNYVSRSNTASDQLVDAVEQNKTLNAQLSQAETQNSLWEAKAEDMKSRIGQLERQLQEQKAAYGELYSQMNKTITDIEKGNDGICDF